uniref:Uncharacterized protein n=1 Tax=Panagrellus redivivus TaxID=6233 RepID=A0A7E4ZRN9_PANRE
MHVTVAIKEIKKDTEKHENKTVYMLFLVYDASKPESPQPSGTMGRPFVGMTVPMNRGMATAGTAWISFPRVEKRWGEGQFRRSPQGMPVLHSK